MRRRLTVSSNNPCHRMVSFTLPSRSFTFIFSFRAAAAALPPGRPSIASSAAFTPFHTVESSDINALMTRSVNGPCPWSSLVRSASVMVDGSHVGTGAVTTADAAFADQVWNLFLGGSSSTRPFGSAVLDGYARPRFYSLFTNIELKMSPIFQCRS